MAFTFESKDEIRLKDPRYVKSFVRLVKNKGGIFDS